MKPRRGLTLLEVLIAATILSLLAATCIPLLQSSLAVLHETSPQLRLDELAQFADEVMAEPTAFGLDTFPERIELAWQEHPERPAVVMRRLDARESDVKHAWVVFTCEGWSVSRWIVIGDPIDPAPSSGSKR